jgi:tape measure domain-containing protein
MEMLRTQLVSVMGGMAGGEQAFSFISKFAKDTPFEIEGLTTSFIMLKNMGLEPTQQVMQSLTDQAAKLGGKQETLTSIVQQLGQAYSKGKLQQEDMIVLAERGVPIYKIAAEVLGVTGDKLAEMSSKGEIGREAIDKIIVKMGELSSGSNARAMDTLNGKISGLSDAWHEFEDALLNDRSEGIIKSIVQSATNSLNILKRNLSDTIDDQLAHSEARIKTYNQMGFVGKAMSDYTGFDIGQEINRRDSLKKQKAAKDAADAEAAAKAEAEAKEKRAAEDKASADAKHTEETLKNSKKRVAAAQSEASAKAKAFNSEREAVAKNIENLQFELKALGLSSEEKTKQLRIRSEAANATESERETIVGLIEAIDAETEAQKRQSAAWQQAIEDANKYYDLKKEIAGMTGGPSGVDSSSSLSSGIARIQDDLKAGVIDDKQAKELFDQLGKSYNENFIDPAKTATSELSEFSTQAARNMQDAFADFLFDPFSDGIGGMAEGFSNALRRMVAEASAAQLFNALLGKDYGKTGELGGILGSFAESITSAYTGSGGGFQGNGPLLSYGNKHSGGIVGEFTGLSMVHPSVFNNAKRFHSGGLVGNEVPIVALKGEEVLTENDPRHAKNYRGGGNVIVNITTPPGTKASESRQETPNGTQINVLIEQIEGVMGNNIARGGGLSSVLERQYGLNRSAGAL